MKRKSYYIKDQRIPVTKCTRPKFSNHAGKCWDSRTIHINEETVEAWMEIVYGTYVYFIYKNQWNKVKAQSEWEDDMKGNKWDVDIFEPELNIEYK